MFTLADFDRYLIAGEGMLHNLVRITKDGVAITIPTYHGQATTQREFVLEAFKSGATLKLEDLDNRHSDIAKICKSLEDILVDMFSQNHSLLAQTSQALIRILIPQKFLLSN